MTDKQADILLGISTKMEKTLSSIEKLLSSNSSKNANISGGLSSVMQSISGMSSIVSKTFNPKKADEILNFTKSLVKISNSVDIEKTKIFGEFVANMSKSFNMLLSVMNPVKLMKLSIGSKILFNGKNSLLKTIVKGISNAFSGLTDKKIKQISEGSKAIKSLGKSLMSLSTGMKSLIVIGIAAPLILAGALVARAVVALFTSIGKNAKDIAKGGDSMKKLGKGLVFFAGGLATMALAIMIIGPTKLAGAIAVIALFGITFDILGKASKNIDRGSKSLLKMGIALMGFSAGLALLMLTIMIATPTMIIAGIATVIAFGMAFWAIGKFSKEIAEGSLVMILGISVGLFIFSGALLVLGMAIKMYSWETLMAGALIVGIFGATFAVLGNFDKNILRGAETMETMAISLLSISVGILAFGVSIKLLQMIFGNDIGSAGMISGGILIGLGMAFAVVGTMSKFTENGVKAMLSIGLALATISGGILVFGVAIKLLQIIFKNDLEKAGMIAGGILIGLGLAFAGIGFLAGNVMTGASAMITVGIALISISFGIMVFGGAIKLLQMIFKDDLEKAGIIAGGILIGLGLAFAGIGLLSMPIMLGSVAMGLVGISLISISLGIFIFGKTIKSLTDSKLMDSNGEMKGINILVDLSLAFSKIGLLSLTPFPWLGIAFSTGMGIALSIISLGIKQAYESFKTIPDTTKFIDTLFGDNGIISNIADSFAKIGKKYGGILSSFLGTDDVSVGIRTVQGIGSVLQELAGGIASFSNFSQFPVKVPNPKDPSNLIYSTVDILGEIIPKLNTNLPIILSTLASTFSDIGNKFGGESGWFGKESPVQMGINAIKGLGAVLSELAGGIVSFANFTEFPIQVVDPKNPGKLIYKSVDLMKSIPMIRTALIGDGVVDGNVKSSSGILIALANVFAEIGNKFGGEGGWFGKESPVKKGIDAVKGIGGVVSDLARGILDFATLDRGLPLYDKKGNVIGYSPVDLNKIKSNINDIIRSVPTIFSSLDTKNLDSAKEKGDKIKPLIEIVSKLGIAMKDLIVPDSKTKRINLLDIMGPSLVKFSSDISGLVVIDNNKMDTLKSFATTLEKLSRMGSDLKVFAEALSSTGKAFGIFGAGFEKFSGQLGNFKSFESSFSNLMEKQFTFKFDKFEESMSKFKASVNAFDIEKLKLTDSVMSSLAAISKSPDDSAQKISDALEKSFDKLVDAIKKMSKESTPVSAPGTTLPTPIIPSVYSTGKTNDNDSSKTAAMLEMLSKSFALMQKDISSLNNKFSKGTNGGILVDQT